MRPLIWLLIIGYCVYGTVEYVECKEAERGYMQLGMPYVCEQTTIFFKTKVIVSAVMRELIAE